MGVHRLFSYCRGDQKEEVSRQVTLEPQSSLVVDGNGEGRRGLHQA
jgi:hypothetical protein